MFKFKIIYNVGYILSYSLYDVVIQKYQICKEDIILHYYRMYFYLLRNFIYFISYLLICIYLLVKMLKLINIIVFNNYVIRLIIYRERFNVYIYYIQI